MTANEPSVAELVEWVRAQKTGAIGVWDVQRDARYEAVALALTRLERRCAEMEKLRLPAELAYSEMAFTVGTLASHDVGMFDYRAARLAECADKLRATLDALPPERANEGTQS